MAQSTVTGQSTCLLIPGADGHLLWIMDVGAALATITLAEAVVVHTIFLLLFLLLGLTDDGQTPLNSTAKWKGQTGSGNTSYFKATMTLRRQVSSSWNHREAQVTLWRESEIFRKLVLALSSQMFLVFGQIYPKSLKICKMRPISLETSAFHTQSAHAAGQFVANLLESPSTDYNLGNNKALRSQPGTSAVMTPAASLAVRAGMQPEGWARGCPPSIWHLQDYSWALRPAWGSHYHRVMDSSVSIGGYQDGWSWNIWSEAMSWFV